MQTLGEKANSHSESKSKLWLQAGLLCFINLINYMDRFTVSGVLTDIEDDFGMDKEWQGGLLQTAFVVCYCASAPIFGFMGDRYSRKYLMILGVLAWTVCTLASSFMPTYLSFLMVRAAIGFGEASFTTIAPTLLGDMFSDSQLSIVLAFFYFAIPIGSGLGYMIGSRIACWMGNWRWGIRSTPVLTAVALLLMIFFLEDKPRGTRARLDVTVADISRKEKLISYYQDLVYLVKNSTYILSTAAFASLTFCTGALSWWGPHFIEDALKFRIDSGAALNSDPTVESVAFQFGLIMCFSGIIGLSLGSGLSYWLRPKVPWIDPVLCGTGLLVSSPFIFLSLHMCWRNVGLAFGMTFLGQLFLNMNWAITVDMSLYVVVPTRRASAEAFQLMAAHALGEAGSPYLIGFIADVFKSTYDGAAASYNDNVPMKDAEKGYWSFQKALYITLGFELLAAVLFLAASTHVVQDRKKAEEEEMAFKFASKNQDPLH